MNENRPVAAVDDCEFKQVAGGVGANEHRETVVEIVDEYRVVEGVGHVVVADAVLAGACGDQRRIHSHKLACSIFECK